MPWGWSPYVPVAQRRANALKKMEKLRKKGLDVQPVRIDERKISRTFWGQAWCDHLESFSDFDNRLPRGRTYVRNGSVCHLEITEGSVKAIVSGSELYNVDISIKKLARKKWRYVKGRCAGQIGSLLELLQGRLSQGVMAVVTDREDGLFPLPGEISLNCSCPDWAVMCKHVAAVLYGVAARLDQKPEMLFLLRGVDHEQLIDTDTNVLTTATTAKTTGSRRIAEGDLNHVFGIEMTEEPAKDTGRSRRERGSNTTATSKTARSAAAATTGKAVRKKSPKRKAKPLTTATPGKTPGRKSSHSKTTSITTTYRVSSGIRTPTGKTVRVLRADFGMTKSQFAQLLDVSASSVARWEKKSGPLNLKLRTNEALDTVAKFTKNKAWKQLDRS